MDSALAPLKTPIHERPGFSTTLERLMQPHPLRVDDAHELMDAFLGGRLDLPQMAALIAVLRTRPVTSDELTGFASSLRNHADPVPAPPGMLMDTCGTGGAKTPTFNVSTLAAFVAAAAGVRIAKHGNRTVNRPSGSADILERLGARLDLDGHECGRLLENEGIAFLFAPQLHPAMRHTADVRRKLGIPTIFNLLGPLANPARPTHQVLGVYAPELMAPVAEALALLGVRDAYVLHGEGGLDEATLAGPTHVIRVRDGTVEEPFTVTPHDVGLRLAPMAQVAPIEGDVTAATDTILNGKGGARSDLVAYNAGFAIHLAGLTPTLREAVETAQEILASGDAFSHLQRYLAATGGDRA